MQFGRGVGCTATPAWYVLVQSLFVDLRESGREGGGVVVAGSLSLGVACQRRGAIIVGRVTAIRW